MQKRDLTRSLGFFLASILVNLSQPVQAEVDPQVHKMCLQAKDYVGCLNSNKKNIDLNKSQEPFCSLLPPNPKEPKSVLDFIACSTCWDAFDLNNEGKSTILSGNKKDREDMIQQAYAVFGQLGATLKETEQVVDNQIVPIAKGFCPNAF